MALSARMMRGIRKEAKEEGESVAHERREYARGRETPTAERKERRGLRARSMKKGVPKAGY